MIFHHQQLRFITLAASNENHNVMVRRPSICPIGILTIAHQGAACNMTSVHLGSTIRRTDILVLILYTQPGMEMV